MSPLPEDQCQRVKQPRGLWCSSGDCKFGNVLVLLTAYCISITKIAYDHVSSMIGEIELQLTDKGKLHWGFVFYVIGLRLSLTIFGTTAPLACSRLDEFDWIGA